MQQGMISFAGIGVDNQGIRYLRYVIVKNQAVQDKVFYPFDMFIVNNMWLIEEFIRLEYLPRGLPQSQIDFIIKSIHIDIEDFDGSLFLVATTIGESVVKNERVVVKPDGTIEAEKGVDVEFCQMKPEWKNRFH